MFRIPYTLSVRPPFRCSSIACCAFCVRLFLSLVFFPSSFLCGFPSSISQRFPTLRLSFPDGLSLHAALLFLRYFRLVRYDLLLRMTSLWFVFLARIFLIDFLSFADFSPSILCHLRLILFACSKIHFPFGCFCLAFQFATFSFLSFVLVGLASDISAFALFIRTPCFALLAPSLSFRSSSAPDFLVLFLFVRCHCLPSSSGFW